jgi:hypothetical protein
MFGQNTDQEMCFNFALYYPMCAMRCAPANLFASVVHLTQGAGLPALSTKSAPSQVSDMQRRVRGLIAAA